MPLHVLHPTTSFPSNPGNISGPFIHRKFNKKTERYIERKIRTLGFSQEEFERLGPEILKRPHVRLWG